MLTEDPNRIGREIAHRRWGIARRQPFTADFLVVAGYPDFSHAVGLDQFGGDRWIVRRGRAVD